MRPDLLGPWGIIAKYLFSRTILLYHVSIVHNRIIFLEAFFPLVIFVSLFTYYSGYEELAALAACPKSSRALSAEYKMSRYYGSIDLDYCGDTRGNVIVEVIDDAEGSSCFETILRDLGSVAASLS